MNICLIPSKAQLIKVDPAPGGHAYLCHIDTPEVIGALSMRLRPHGTAARLKVHIRGNHKLVFFHKPVYAFLVNRDVLAILKIRPDSPVAPERMIGFDFLDFSKKRLIAFYNR